MLCFCDRKLAEIVIANSNNLQVLEKHDIDFYCKGWQTLREACNAKGINVHYVSNELRYFHELVSQALSFNTFSISQICEYIVYTHHAYLRQNLPALRTHFHLLKESISAELFDGIESQLDYLQPAFLEMIEFEEKTVFPLLVASGKQAVPEPQDNIMSVTGLMREQQCTIIASLNALMQDAATFRIGNITVREFFTRLDQLKRDVHMQLHIKNNILLPRFETMERKFRQQDNL